MADHYFTKEPTSRPIIKEISATIRGTKFTFKTSSGIFAKDKLDKGSLLLLYNCMPGKRTLDLGCGYGLIGIALKKLCPKIEMTCSDINSRAVMLAGENAKINGVSINAVQSDIYENVKGGFDAILVNLPQNAGKNVCFRMIEGALPLLSKEGTFQAVSRHKKGGRSYEKKMLEVFGNCTYLAKGSGYRVYMSRKA